MIQAACNSFETLAVLRALGGAAEACADPAFMLITSMWYTRREQPVRLGLWYTANGLGIALGGLLGYGIGHLRGALPSWKYEFLVMYAVPALIENCLVNIIQWCPVFCLGYCHVYLPPRFTRHSSRT
jgi:MFS family permease